MASEAHAVVDAHSPPDAPTVCVTGAAGFIGSWLVMRLLERGYNVHATVRDPEQEGGETSVGIAKSYDTNLTLWKADLTVEGSFDEASHSRLSRSISWATPKDFESKDPENEVIKPTVRGMLSIIESCAKAKTVKRLVFTSSAGTLDVQEHQKLFYDETSWSDLDFIYAKKMTGWRYFVSKILAEKAAMEETKKNNIDFISIIPPLVVGPFITSAFPPSLITALSLITGNEAHYCIIKQGQYVHLDDLCEGHIFLYEHPKPEGRFICSSHHAIIYDVAKMVRQKWPEYYVPTEFKGIDKDSPIVYFSSKKLMDMGFQFKYTLEDMYKGAIKTCRQKQLLPLSTRSTADNGHDKETIPISAENYASGKENAPIANCTGKLTNDEI